MQPHLWLWKRPNLSLCPQNSQSHSTPASLALSPTSTSFVHCKASSGWQMTLVEKAVIVPQCERRVFFFLALFSLFYFSPFSIWGRGEEEVSLNWLMCSIHQTLYTSSIKQESALYAGTIVPLRAAKKASYKLPWKKIALSTTPVKSNVE